MSSISEPKLTLKRRRQTVQFFVEPLNNELGIEMMLIPAGTFMMGSPEDELERSPSEGPQHEVSIATFFMGKYPVTQEQWRFVARLPSVNRSLKQNPSQFKGDKRPVETVSWYDAVEFCDRLSTYTSRPYRLPTEAEWEYGCRAGTTTPFHFGETMTSDLANYSGYITYNNESQGETRGETTPIDHFGITNTFGLCDMHGNVFEWCQDHWHDSYEGAATDGSAWLSGNEYESHVLRGGSWTHNPRHCRSAYRLNYLPGFSDITFGLRVVCSAPMVL